MEQYISKSALVAEIESLRRTSFTNFDEGVNAAVQTLLEALDTLEVKEVNSNDAFIEKASEWFKIRYEWIDIDGTRNYDKSAFEDFKNYMKGE